MGFRNRLYQLWEQNKAMYVSLGGKNGFAVWVLQGPLWGRWMVGPKKLKWYPLTSTLPWHEMWSQRVRNCVGGEIKPREFMNMTTEERKIYGFFKTWCEEQKYVHEQPVLGWARAQGADQKLLDLLSNWEPTGLGGLSLLLNEGLAYRQRLYRNLQDHQPRSLLRLLRYQHPRVSKGHLKVICSKGVLARRYLGCNVQFTRAHVEAYSGFWGTDTSTHIEPQWRLLSLHRRHPRNPQLVRELGWYWRHHRELVRTVLALHRPEVVIPVGIHTDLDRLGSLQAVRAAEARIRDFREATIKPIQEQIRERLRAQWQQEVTEYRWTSQWLKRHLRRKKAVAQHTLHWQQLPELAGHLDEPEGVRLLTTKEEFGLEGAQMSHCVGSHVGNTNSLYFAVDRPEGRATLMVTPTPAGGKINQLFGKYNARMPSSLWKALQPWVSTLTLPVTS